MRNNIYECKLGIAGVQRGSRIGNGDPFPGPRKPVHGHRTRTDTKFGPAVVSLAGGLASVSAAKVNGRYDLLYRLRAQV